MKRSKSEIRMNRAVAVPVLVRALGKARDMLDPGTVLTAKEIVSKALQDPDDGVRVFTVHTLGRFGTEDMIPALRKVVETDPSPEVQGHSIRKSAVEAIAAIEQRTRKQ
jgi:HEAT repeat protein